ncbi:hypothetical protein BDV12DRAFT_191572 [Aspergillus spectabilis]
MVFCGKPSKGCGECRSRKIRCDQGRPTCSQCAKGNRACPGYRDELSLIFRDESQQVVRKTKTGASGRRNKKPAARAASKKSSPAVLPDSRGSSSTESPVAPSSVGKESPSVVSTSSPSINFGSDFADFNETEEGQLINREQLLQLDLVYTPWKVQPSWQLTVDEAVNYVLRHDVWPAAIFMMNFEPKSPGHPSALLSEQAQMAALISVGTAMLSRREYGHALTLLTCAVCNEEQSRANSTLSAVLLLAIFEVITSRSIKSIEKWTNHIYGAAALLELRGPEHLQAEEGLKLFVQLRFQIIISCLQRGMRVPKSLFECTKIAIHLRPHIDAYCDRLICIAGKLSNIRADIREKVMKDANGILSAAYALEADLLAWVAAGPPDFLYTTYECSSLKQWVRMFGNKPFPYNNQYHVYSDLWICHTWNHCLRRLSAVSPMTAMSKELQNHCARIRNVTRELAGDICASAAYHLGVEGSPAAAFTVPTNYCYVGGMLLLWPLTLAGGTEPKNHPLRKWTRDCLRLIGHSVGNQRIAVAEDSLHKTGFLVGTWNDKHQLERIKTYFRDPREDGHQLPGWLGRNGVRTTAEVEVLKMVGVTMSMLSTTVA